MTRSKKAPERRYKVRYPLLENFLKKRRLYSAFCRNLVRDITSTQGKHAIYFAFIWRNTPEGSDVWAKADEDWRFFYEKLYGIDGDYEAICPKCYQPCRVLEKDYGESLDFHGAVVWRPDIVPLSACCEEELQPEDYKLFQHFGLICRALGIDWKEYLTS